MRFQGKVWKFGDHVDTDLIVPARFLNTSDVDILARACFVDLRPDFARDVRQGDIILAGMNFGCGSSREHAPLAIKGLGVAVIVARSFARIFFRNALNLGLPVAECEEAHDAISEGDRVSVDLSSGEILHLDSGRRFMAKPVPDFMRDMIRAGGLVDYIKQQGFSGPQMGAGVEE
jgi:3-isopropylmalate/(R)-2-methylmalate dehydratase small subunit